MALFRYTAYAEAGKKIAGVIDADSYEMAKERLQKQKLLLLRLQSLKEGEKKLLLPSKIALAFTQEMAQLLAAGLPIYESLLTIEEKYRRNKSHSVFLDFCDQLKQGSLLSSALKKYPESFDRIYISLVKAGEQTGSLPFVYQQLTDLLLRKQKLKKQLFSSLMYPAFLGSFCVLIVFALLFFVVPSMRDLFEGRALHPVTQTVLALSDFLKNNFLSLSSLLGFSILFSFWFFKKEKGKLFIQGILVKTPFIKDFLLYSAIIRFTRTLSILLKGGVPLLQAIDLSKEVVPLLALRRFFEGVQKKVGEGKTFSSEMIHPLIPMLVPRMLKTAEDTGKMPEMLQSVGEIYEEELDKNLTYFTTLLQPVLLIFLGAIVGVILLSILLPLTDVSSFISS